MTSLRISIIAAIGKNRELGRGNDLIWRIPADLKRVKELTMGHPIIMGRKTYESIGRPLPGRTNIVITRTPTPIEGCVVFDSLEKALEHAHSIEQEEIFIFGGASIYEAGLPYTNRLYLTLIHENAPDADVFFPDYSLFMNEIFHEDHYDHSPSYSWITYERA